MHKRCLDYSPAAEDVLPMFHRRQFRLLMGGAPKANAAMPNTSESRSREEYAAAREQQRLLPPSERHLAPPPIDSTRAAFLAQLTEAYGSNGIESDSDDTELPFAMRKHINRVLNEDA